MATNDKNQSTANENKQNEKFDALQKLGITGSGKETEDLVKTAKDTKDVVSGILNNGPKQFAAGSAARAGKRSIIGMAAKNTFEFPVFVSKSVPLDYATATNSLLEQIYASYLQMAISLTPVIATA